MANTVDVVELDPETWVDAYAETGIPPGTRLILNVVQTETKVYASISADEPDEPSKKIVPIPNEGTGLSAVVTAGEAGCWLRSTSASVVSVQDGTL